MSQTEDIEFVFDLKELQDNFCKFDEAFYNLTDGGYLDPMALLEDKELAQKVKDAVWLVHQFIEAACSELECMDDDESEDEI